MSNPFIRQEFKIHQIDKTEVFRERRRTSRNDECRVFNACLYVLMKENFTVLLKKSKKALKTSKLLLPSVIQYANSNILFTQESFSKLAEQLEINEKPASSGPTEADQKRLRRNLEADMNNGVLYLLKEVGYNIQVKKTKKTNVTKKLIRINELRKPGLYLSRENLLYLGHRLEQIVDAYFSLYPFSGSIVVNDVIKELDPHGLTLVPSNRDLSYLQNVLRNDNQQYNQYSNQCVSTNIYSNEQGENSYCSGSNSFTINEYGNQIIGEQVYGNETFELHLRYFSH